MAQVALIAAAGLLAYGAWRMSQDDTGQDAAAQPAPDDSIAGEWLGTAGDVLANAGQTAAGFVDNITGGSLKLSNMARVTVADVNHPNVQALLRVIRRGEGTADEAGFRRLFGGELFDGYADHPRRKITRTLRSGGTITSTAAGAFQFLAGTWDETRNIMKLPDFSPASQTRAAVGRIAARGALEDAKAGALNIALKKIAWEWASMPGSPYGQPVISWETAHATYAAAGGSTYA